LALQTPKFYLAGSIEPKVRRARKPGFLQSIDRKNPQVEQALREALIKSNGGFAIYGAPYMAQSVLLTRICAMK
jgi:hypothetical protein